MHKHDSAATAVLRLLFFTSMAMNETRTNALKKLIEEKLKTLTTNVFFEQATDNALYPHIVFNFRTVRDFL